VTALWTPIRLIPRNLATSAAGYPTSSTASQASREIILTRIPQVARIKKGSSPLLAYIHHYGGHSSAQGQGDVATIPLFLSTIVGQLSLVNGYL